MHGKTKATYRDVASQIAPITRDVKQPEGKFAGWVFTQTENHWANHSTNVELVDSILVPYGDRTRIRLFGTSTVEKKSAAEEAGTPTTT